MTSTTPSDDQLADWLLVIAADQSAHDRELLFHAAEKLRRLSETERNLEDAISDRDNDGSRYRARIAGLETRLAETERERDDARALAAYRLAEWTECGAELQEKTQRCQDAEAERDRIAEIIGLNGEFELPEAIEILHKERDQLREMLAQADAAHAYEQWTIDGKGAAPMTQQEYYQRYDEARHRHRLSQKGSAS